MSPFSRPRNSTCTRVYTVNLESITSVCNILLQNSFFFALLFAVCKKNMVLLKVVIKIVICKYHVRSYHHLETINHDAPLKTVPKICYKSVRLLFYCFVKNPISAACLLCFYVTTFNPKTIETRFQKHR